MSRALLCVGPMRFALQHPLHISLEYPSEEGVLASWTDRSTFCAAGDDDQDAVNNLLELLAADLSFYAGKQDCELSQDAIRARNALNSIFSRIS